MAQTYSHAWSGRYRLLVGVLFGHRCREGSIKLGRDALCLTGSSHGRMGDVSSASRGHIAYLCLWVVLTCPEGTLLCIGRCSRPREAASVSENSSRRFWERSSTGSGTTVHICIGSNSACFHDRIVIIVINSAPRLFG